MNYLIELTKKLKEMSWMISCAESCTGGLLASMLTEQPGSSAWFDRGFVTYTNQAKHELLQVPSELLDTFGAVSEPVAQTMALGAIQHSHSQLAVSITGIAGPDGGSSDKPVGTVWFGVCGEDGQPQAYLKQFGKLDRQTIRKLACEYALELCIDHIAARP